VSGQLQALAALTLYKEPLVAIDRRLGGPLSWSGRREEEKILDPVGTLNSDPSVVQSVASYHHSYLVKHLRKYNIFLILILEAVP
jgi:hypothetical protein